LGGRTENCQVGVFLAYSSPGGTAFLDRALYLPEEWTDDPDRCEETGVPEGTALKRGRCRDSSRISVITISQADDAILQPSR
jgi:SRSO17 transposase